ncbi:uncharacterized protein [Paramormyrops kingsleyae]|uniref:uncharacterized protein isoform X1 n=1 Tax=Paramormyrops kingsleyae TaxID=1676925 RepID=UPI000CD5D62E|nr:uncharacterized protein LOC111840054 isoform X2 [Paramormyrops kingsleyae]
MKPSTFPLPVHSSPRPYCFTAYFAQACFPESVMENSQSDDSELAGPLWAMLWSVTEAAEKQTLQIGASACGATAVVDVLQALGIPVSPETADECVQTRLRRNEAPLWDYLLSRSEAGATQQQLIEGAEHASGGQVVGRFFALHPPRRLQLVPWLASWISRGAVPVATMNMQQGVHEGEEIPDAWHHQLVFGVGPSAVYMTNPLDVGEDTQKIPLIPTSFRPIYTCKYYHQLVNVISVFKRRPFVSEAVMHKRLCSESVLLIRREDVLQRWLANTPASTLSEVSSHPRWTTLDVEEAGYLHNLSTKKAFRPTPKSRSTKKSTSLALLARSGKYAMRKTVGMMGS